MTPPLPRIPPVDASGAAGAADWIGVRRFADWRALRQWVLREAADAGPGRRVETLRVFVPTNGAASALRGALGERMAAGAVLPTIQLAGSFLADLAGDLDPPFRLAPETVREILIEEALAAGSGDPGAPPGDSGHLVVPLLNFLEEQAGDREIDPGRTAFEAFASRAAAHFEEARETDRGAERLFALNEWLRGVHTRFRADLDALGRGDADGLRRRLFAERRELRLRFAHSRMLALGTQALRPAEARLLAALLPPGQLVFGLVGETPDPLVPGSVDLRELPARDPPERRRTLFGESSPPPRRGRILVPASAGGEPGFRATDRDGEIRIAAALLARGRADGARRCALAAQNPRDYLESAGFLLPESGFALRTRLGRPLAGEPWVAALGEVLAFAAQPGRLSLGLCLLRGAFFRDPALPEPPGRAADALAREALAAGIRNTNDPADLPRLAARFRERAGERRARAEGSPDPERQLAYARSLAAAAAALDSLVAAAAALAPLGDPEAGFGEAVEALIAFAEEHLPDSAAGDASVRELAFDVLHEAAAAAPGSLRAGGPEAIGRRIRRLLGRRTLPPGSAGGEEADDPPSTGPGGGPPGEVELIAARDAPFGDHDFLVLLGVVDADWPRDRPGNIFFPNRVLERATRSRRANRAAEEIRLLRSLVALPAAWVAFTRPELVDGFPAATSPLAGEIAEAARELEAIPFAVPTPEPAPAEDALPLPTGLSRRAPTAAVLEHPVSPSGIDSFAKNPAQFFAGSVLGLEEERPLDDVPAPVERGKWLHAFLQRAYEGLRASGAEVTESDLEAVIARFREEFRRFAEAQGLDGVERRIEEQWLFGSDDTPPAMEWFLREEVGRGPAKPVGFEERIAGELEAATGTRPALRVRGRYDRLDERPDGSRRVLEFKSGRFYEKPLQPRVYARILEGADGRRTDFALPYFGNRRWIGPEDRPSDADQDAALRNLADGLAAGCFPPAAEDGQFDFPLVTRRDLPDPDGDSDGESGGEPGKAPG